MTSKDDRTEDHQKAVIVQIQHAMRDRHRDGFHFCMDSYGLPDYVIEFAEKEGVGLCSYNFRHFNIRPPVNCYKVYWKPSGQPPNAHARWTYVAMNLEQPKVERLLDWLKPCCCYRLRQVF